MMLFRTTPGEAPPLRDAEARSSSDGTSCSLNPHLWTQARPQSDETAELRNAWQIWSFKLFPHCRTWDWKTSFGDRLLQIHVRGEEEGHLPKQASSPLSHLPTPQQRENEMTSTRIRNALKGLQVFQPPYLSLKPDKTISRDPRNLGLLRLCQRTILLDWTPWQNPRAWPRQTGWMSLLSTALPTMYQRTGLEKNVSVIWCNRFFKTIF